MRQAKGAADWVGRMIARAGWLGLVLLAGAAGPAAWAGNATVPGDLSAPYPTVVNLGILWEITGEPTWTGWRT